MEVVKTAAAVVVVLALLSSRTLIPAVVRAVMRRATRRPRGSGAGP